MYEAFTGTTSATREAMIRINPRRNYPSVTIVSDKSGRTIEEEKYLTLEKIAIRKNRWAATTRL